jgi:sporulation protein YlmC with PRC-barrel domain
MKKIALITASLAFLAAPAFAEDAKTTGTAPAEAKFSTVSKDEMFSSKLKGLNVYNQKDESVGEITDLAIKNHQIDALILSVGGFLGMGEHYVAVSPSSVNVRYDSKNNKWLASMKRSALAVRCRAGAVTNAGVWYGPGSAEQREERCTASGTRYFG